MSRCREWRLAAHIVVDLSGSGRSLQRCRVTLRRDGVIDVEAALARGEDGYVFDPGLDLGRGLEGEGREELTGPDRLALSGVLGLVSACEDRLRHAPGRADDDEADEGDDPGAPKGRYPGLGSVCHYLAWQATTSCASTSESIPRRGHVVGAWRRSAGRIRSKLPNRVLQGADGLCGGDATVPHVRPGTVEIAVLGQVAVRGAAGPFQPLSCMRPRRVSRVPPGWRPSRRVVAGAVARAAGVVVHGVFHLV